MLNTKKFLSLFLLIIFLTAQEAVTIIALSEHAQAAIDNHNIAKAQEQSLVNNDEVSESEADPEDIDPEAQTEIPDAVWQTLAPLDIVVDKVDGTVDLPPPIVFDPFDQTILELYWDPDKAFQKLVEPGSDRAAFESLVQGQFGLNPSLTGFDTLAGDARLYEQVVAVLANQQKLDYFISALQESIDKNFVTELNKAIIEHILQIAKDAKGNHSFTTRVLANADTLQANPETRSAARKIVDEFTKVFENVENGTPVLASLFRAIEPLPLDERVVNTLLYLVTPRDQGGAGHERIKVQRIWKDYADEKRAISRESKGADNQSAHHRGQAIDISEIDNIKCTLYKSGWVKKKKTARPPIPIKVSWQSQDSLAQTPEGSSNLPLGFTSMFDVIRETGLNNILDGFTDLDIDNLEEGSLKDAGFSDILKAVGEQLVIQAIGMTGSNLSGFNFNDIITKVGQAYLADKLGIPRYAFKGIDLERELQPNIGRAELEKRLNLPADSLKGENLDQILRSVGARKLEKSLNLRKGALSAGFSEAIVGQGYIEQQLNLKSNAFAGNSIDDTRRSLGDFRFKTTFAQNPTFVDDQLKIAAGTTQNFLSSGNADSYKRAVGKRVIDDGLRIFPNNKENVLLYIDKIDAANKTAISFFINRPSAQNNVPAELKAIDKTLNGDPSTPGPNNGGLLFQPSFRGASGPRSRRFNITAQEVTQAAADIQTQVKTLKKRLQTDQELKNQLVAIDNPAQLNIFFETSQFSINALLDRPIATDLTRIINRRDEMFNTPQGSLGRLMGGDNSAFIDIGKQELATHLSYSSVERGLIVAWFNDGAPSPLGSIEPALTSRMGLSANDVQRFFTTGSTDVLRRIGERRLLTALLNLPETKKFENDFLRDNPDLAQLYTNINFRLDRLRAIKRDLTRLNQLATSVDTDGSVRRQIDKSISNPGELDAAIRQIGRLWDQLDKNQQIRSQQEAVGILNDIQQNFQGLVDGQFNRSLSSISAREIGANRQSSFDLSVTPSDVFDLISKRKTPPDVLQTIGFRAVEGSLGLPSESLFLFAKSGEKSPENFFSSIGQGRINELYGKGDLATVIGRNRLRADRDLGLKRGSTDAFLGQTTTTAGGTIDIGTQLFNAYNTGRAAALTDVAEPTEGSPLPTVDTPGPSYNQALANDTTTGLTYQNGYRDGLNGVNSPPPNNGQQVQSPTASATINLNAKQYLEVVGRQTIAFSSIRRLVGNLQINGIGFTPDDVYLMLTGGAQDVFARVAGYKLDQELRLYPGSMRSIVAARSSQERDDAIAIAGGAYLGNLLGIGPIDFRTGDPTQATGADIIERTFGFKEGSVRKSNSLQELATADPKANDKLFGVTTDDVKRADRLLHLEIGTTQKLHDGVLTLPHYVQIVGRKNLEYRLADSRQATQLVLSIFGLDRDNIRDQHERDMITLMDVVIPKISHTLIDNGNLGKALIEWSPQDRRLMFTALDDMFGLELDRRTRVAPGTWAAVISTPDQARQILLREGITSIDQQFGLDGKLKIAYNFYTLQKVDYQSAQAERTMVISRSGNSAYEAGKKQAEDLLREHPIVVTGTTVDEPTGEITGEQTDDSDFQTNKQAYFEELYGNYSGDDAVNYTRGFNDIILGNKPQVVSNEAVSGNQTAINVNGFLLTSKQQAINEAQNFAANQIQQTLFELTRIRVPTPDVIALAQGDVRVFQYIGLTQAVKQLREFAGAQNLPQKYQITYEDLRGTIEGTNFDDLAKINLAGAAETQKWRHHFAAAGSEGSEFLLNWLNQNYPPLAPNQAGPEIPRDVETAKTLFIKSKKDQVEKDKVTQLGRENQQYVQYKMMDIAAYQLDHNIPVGFTQAMFTGNDKQRFNSLLDYLQNSVTSGVGFSLPEGSLRAVAQYFENGRTDALFQTIPQGVFNTMENYVNTNKLVGFELPQGSMYALFHFAQTQNVNELLPVSGAGAAPTLGAILGRPIFSWADKTLNMPTGTTFQIASLAFQINQAAQAVRTADDALSLAAAFGSTDQIIDAGRNYGNASNRLDAVKGALASFVVTTVFQKQLLQADKAFGLVPGSMGILVGHGASLAFVAFNPVTFAITIVVFLVLNIFGFNRTQLLCTGDGYWPRITTSTKDLYLGLGEFDGMNPTLYRQGLLTAARGRVRGLIEDLMRMPYHVDEQGNFSLDSFKEINDDMKPTQILTRRPEDFEYFYHDQTLSRLYAAVFNENEPSATNRQGILTGNDFFVDGHVHIGF